MPVFSRDGPNVPDELVQDLEDDRVVLFCGAGISMDAGLPDFGGLVKAMYNGLGKTLPGKRSKEWLWPDRMLGDLEAEFGTDAVRREVVRILGAPPTRLDVHTALLRLARMKAGDGVRLVTTNFDTYFEEVRKPSLDFARNLHAAPALPIPRNDRDATWQSVVHLHGRLEAAPHSNRHLVLTSADFGRAYLTDGWAARFVARLFADFSVLFVGYSLNDPVLRYMTDAFAAEIAATRVGTARPMAYIFVGDKAEAPDKAPWVQRGLHPIFYDPRRHHRRLRETLVAWANQRDDWLSSTQAVLGRLATKEPERLSPGDVDNVLWWVLRRGHKTGLGARIFAELEPAPPIGWLDVMVRREDAAQEEHRKAVKEADSRGEPRPNPPATPISSLTVPESSEGTWLSPVADHLAQWLVRHLGNRKAVDWAAGHHQQGRVLLPSYATWFAGDSQGTSPGRSGRRSASSGESCRPRVRGPAAASWPVTRGIFRGRSTRACSIR